MKKYTITSKDGQTQATIVPERGAFVSSLILPFVSGQRESVFLHDYAWDNSITDLPGGIPFLFPICGRIERDGAPGTYLYDGHRYQLNIHGFSWYLPWKVEHCDESSITVFLQETSETLSLYPFSFEIRLRFTVQEGIFKCYQQYKNTDARLSMPYYAGFHPYFATPEAGKGKEEVILEFESIRHLQYNTRLTDIVGETLNLTSPLCISDPGINEQLCMLDKNKLAILIYPNGDCLNTNISGPNEDLFSYIQLYTIPEKPFFCVERWMSFPNAMNTVLGVRWLAPGEIDEAVFEISV